MTDHADGIPRPLVERRIEMTTKKPASKAGAVELQESQLDKATGGTFVADTVVQKVVGGVTNKIADGSVRPVLRTG
jgi:hypothetical protein